MCGDSLIRLLRAKAIVSVPILPMYILKARINFPCQPKSARQPVDKPLVLKAETDSKTMSRNATDGSKIAKAKQERKMIINDMITMEYDLSTISNGMVRF